MDVSMTLDQILIEVDRHGLNERRKPNEDDKTFGDRLVSENAQLFSERVARIGFVGESPCGCVEC